MNPVIKILRKNKYIIDNSSARIPYMPIYRFRLLGLGESKVEGMTFEFSWIVDEVIKTQSFEKLIDRMESNYQPMLTQSTYGPIVYESIKFNFDTTVLYSDPLHELLLDTHPLAVMDDERRLKVSFFLLINYQYLLSQDGKLSLRCKTDVLRIVLNGIDLDLSELKKFDFDLFPKGYTFAVNRNDIRDEIIPIADSKKIR